VNTQPANQESESPVKTSALRFWTRDSSVLLAGILLTMMLVIYFWWPLAAALIRRIDWNGQWWLQLDWLLIGIFTFMSLTIVTSANLKRDALLIFVGLCGGLVIEAWGTQTNLWHYYTAERPPLWIIPAWPIANLSIDRITKVLYFYNAKYFSEKAFKITYWIIFSIFLSLMTIFVAPTFDKSFTLMSFAICLFITITPTDYRRAVLTFIAGTGLGYFLELWGTSHRCWTYYTHEIPPLFAVLAHGMAAVAFWRTALVLTKIAKKVQTRPPEQIR